MCLCECVCERERERERESLIWLMGKRGAVEGSRVELAKNILILGKLYSTPPSPQSKRGEREREREVM